MSYNSLDRHGREDAAGTREDLAELGITTTVSQIARHDRALSAWRGGRLSLLGLCAATGWETDRLRPTYWEHPDRGWVVLMTLADLEAARSAARERNRAGGELPLCGVWANRRSDDTPVLVSLPVVTVVRRSKTPCEQLLTGPAWQITDHPGLVAAEKPANRPHRPDRGIPCALCDVYDAHHMRRDERGWPGVICDDCAERSDTSTLMWPDA